jgi:hypothetical protein
MPGASQTSMHRTTANYIPILFFPCRTLLVVSLPEAPTPISVPFRQYEQHRSGTTRESSTQHLWRLRPDTLRTCHKISTSPIISAADFMRAPLLFAAVHRPSRTVSHTSIDVLVASARLRWPTFHPFSYYPNHGYVDRRLW